MSGYASYLFGDDGIISREKDEIRYADGVGVNGDFPDALTWTGCAVVIGAGLFVVSRERAAARAS